MISIIAAATILACWDSTFAYNTFRVEATEARFYVSMSGSSLPGREGRFVASNDAEQLRLGPGWDSSQHHWHVSFPRSQCAFDAEAKSLSCAAGDLMVNESLESFYRTRPIDELGTVRQITSTFAVQRLELSASPTRFELKKLHRYPGTGEVVEQKLFVEPYVIGDEPQPLDCSENAENWAPLVPQALVTHLEASSS